MGLTERQHAKAAELSGDVLKRRRELDQMQEAIDTLTENLHQARACRAKAAGELRDQVAALNFLLETE